MKLLKYDRDNYFIGENGVYLEIKNTKEYVDNDGIKRVIVELKDEKKIKKILEILKIVETKNDGRPVELIFDEEVHRKTKI